MANSTGSFTVQTNGQTLVVTATYKGGLAAGTATLYSDAAVTSSVTLPQTITANTTYYVATPGTYTISVKQIDGTELWGKSLDLDVGRTATIAPIPSGEQVSADVSSSYVQSNAYQAGREILPRWLIDSSSGLSMTSQVLRLTFFTATASETIGSLSVMTGTTAAGATPTLVRMGLYTVADNGDISLAASTANDTALLAAQSTVYTKAVSVNYAVTAGLRYAFGLLVVTAAAAPTVMGKATQNSAMSALAPRLGSGISGQADLPASVTNANINTLGSGSQIWGALVPA